jgi:hypothetical protein
MKVMDALRGHQWAARGLALAVAVAPVLGWQLAAARYAPEPAGPCAGRHGVLIPQDRGGVGRIRMRRAQERLGLSDRQAEAIQAVLREMRDDTRTDRRALCEAQAELLRLQGRWGSDPAAVEAAGDRVRALMAKLVHRQVAAQITIRSTLSADEWAKWLEFRQQRADPWMGPFAGLL